jgi:DNA-directed RNA polymerase subunit alpha
LELPSQVIRDEHASTDRYGRFIIEPFERGFGTTVGNSLRRILLSSLEGAAVTDIKINGAGHEFTSLEGVLEDVTNIVLNVKSLIIKFDADSPKMISVSRSTKGEVRGGDIQSDPSVEIVNKDHLIATLTDDVEFSMSMTVKSGRGYQPADEDSETETEIGVIPVDAIYSPVTRVRYKTEETRVGQRVNYDRLILEVWTKGTVRPEDALTESAKILRKHLNPFVQSHELGEDEASEPPASESADTGAGMDAEVQEKLAQPISALDLSVRAVNCLESAKICTVGELAKMAEAELLQVRSFGRTSLREVKRKLQDMGLSLGKGASGGNGSNE